MEVLLDDRDERPGKKFKDADLIGIPLRVTIGPRQLKEGKIEVKLRKEAEAITVPVEGAVDHILGLLEDHGQTHKAVPLGRRSLRRKVKGSRRKGRKPFCLLPISAQETQMLRRETLDLDGSMGSSPCWRH